MAEITIPADDARDQYTASSGQTVFPYTFPVFDENNIKVVHTVGAVSTTLTIATDYTVSGVGVAGGGNITFLTGAATGDIVTLERTTPYARVTDFQTAGDYRAETINRELDLVTMQLQQLDRDLTRTVTLKTEDTTSSIELPTATNRADRVLAFDSSGAVSMEDTASSSAGQAAASATSAAADAASTAADKIATNADAVSTAADKVATNADAAATALDKIATNADAVSTAADKVATNADAAATALDKTATNADAVSTAADAVATAADAVSTAADAVSTAADAASVSRETALGIAGLDANTEVIRLPAGAAAEVTASRGDAVKKADNSWELKGKVLQVVEHTWTVAYANAATTFQVVTGSTFSFTPKSASSMLYIDMDVSSHVYSSTLPNAGGRYSIRHNGTALHPENLPNYEHYIGFVATSGSSVDNYTRVNKKATVASGSTAARTIEIASALYTGDFIGVNTASAFESYIRVIEVEA